MAVFERALVGRAGDGGPPPVPLAPWPVDRPDDWPACVNETTLADEELARLRAGAQRGRPFGDAARTARTAAALETRGGMFPGCP